MDHHAIDTATEHTSLLQNDNAGAAQPVSPVTDHYWADFPKYPWLLLLIFLFGSGVDYLDGSIFSAGYLRIGQLYQQQDHAAWITIVYATVFAVLQPVYSIASTCHKWTIILSFAFIAFALGQVIALCARPPDPELTPTTSFTALVLLLIARAVAAVGSCAMVYVPNLVFNAVPSSDRAVWEAVQALIQTAAALVGRGIADQYSGNTQQLQRNRTFTWQIIIAVMCAIGLGIWGKLQRRSSSDGTDIKPDLRVSERTVTQPGEAGGGDTPRPDNATTYSNAGSLILLAVAVICVCVSLSIFSKEYLQRTGKSKHHFGLAMLAHFVVGCIFLCAFYASERRLTTAAPHASLFPWSLDATTRQSLGRILLVDSSKNAVVNTFLFILPWYSQASSTPNARLFWSYDIGSLLGTIAAGISLKRWSKRIPPFLRPKPAVSIGTTSFLLASFCLWINWTWFQCKWLSYAANTLFSLGNGLVSATLLPCMLEELGEHKKKHQAMVYAGFHLLGNLSYPVVTAMANVAVQLLAAAYMLEDRVSEEDIRSCLQNLEKCVDALDPHAREVVQRAFVKTSARFALVIFLGSVVIAGMVAFLLKNYKLESHIVEGEETQGDETLPRS